MLLAESSVSPTPLTPERLEEANGVLKPTREGTLNTCTPGAAPTYKNEPVATTERGPSPVGTLRVRVGAAGLLMLNICSVAEPSFATNTDVPDTATATGKSPVATLPTRAGLAGLLTLNTCNKFEW
jgi:hypothetical protein